MNTLLYLGYGPGPHLAEIAFSILSALHRAGPRRAFRVVVYASRPRPRLRRLCWLAVVHRLQDWGWMRHRMKASG